MNENAPKIDKRHTLNKDEWIEADKWVQVKSSNVKGIKYDKENKMLSVEFKQVKGKGGGIWDYNGVPESVAKSMFSTQSMGKFVHYQLKGKYHERKRIT